jgi:small subunit ribosomal protein S2
MSNSNIIQYSITSLLNADTHIGYHQSQRHTNNSNSILTTHNNYDIINIESTLEALEPVLHLISHSVANYEKILFIAQHPTQDIHHYPQPLLTSNWIYGTLSNFKQIKKTNPNYLDALTRLPNLIILLNTKNNNIILRESKLLEIITIALSDTNNDPNQVLYSIPTNNTSNLSLNLYLSLFKKACFYGYAQNILSFKPTD